MTSSLKKNRAVPSLGNSSVGHSLGSVSAGPSQENVMEASCCSRLARDRRAAGAGGETAWWLDLGTGEEIISYSYLLQLRTTG